MAKRANARASWERTVMCYATKVESNLRFRKWLTERSRVEMAEASGVETASKRQIEDLTEHDQQS
jgi:hypothetical protein